MTAKFWVGGTGTWDNSTTTHWALSTGGAGGAAVPGAGDTITFDGSSGTGTVTVDTTINGLTFNTITMGAFVGTLDFSVNNPSITLGANGVMGISATGTATRTLKLGSGIFTLKASSTNCLDFTTTTGLTYDTTSTATFRISPSGSTSNQTIITGGLSFTNNTLDIQPGATAVLSGTGATFKALTFSGSGAACLYLSSGQTFTITNALNLAGSSSGLITINAFSAPQGAKGTLAIASGSVASWANFYNAAFSVNNLVATNSFNGGNTSGLTLTGPSAGGAGAVIGS